MSLHQRIKNLEAENDLLRQRAKNRLKRNEELCKGGMKQYIRCCALEKILSYYTQLMTEAVENGTLTDEKIKAEMSKSLEELTVEHLMTLEQAGVLGAALKYGQLVRELRQEPDGDPEIKTGLQEEAMQAHANLREICVTALDDAFSVAEKKT